MKNQSKLSILLRMLVLVKPLSKAMVLAVIFGTMGFLTAQFIPILGGYGVLAGVGEKIPFSLKIIFILLGACALTRALFRYLEQYMNHYIAFTLLAIIRDKVFKALRRLSPAKLEGRDKGDLISLITSDVELLEVFYAHTISPICIAFLTELAMVLFIGSYHWLLGLLALVAFLAVGVVLPLVISKLSGTVGDELRADSGRLATHMLESIRGIDEILQYDGGTKRLNEITEKTEKLSNRLGILGKLTGTNLAIANAVVLFFDIGMLLLALWLYKNGCIGVDGVVIPLIALMSSFGPVVALSALGTTLQNTVAAGVRVLAIIDEEPQTEDIFGQEKTDFDGAKIDDVTFSYKDELVLKNLSLEIPKDKVVGIVGKSGCGKSTLLKLLMRFWAVKNGDIFISSKSIEKINTADLRKMESYMTQETQLFQDTLANNVRIGKLNATQSEIEAACKKASIHDFITTLPKGYETLVGELGDTLSGGERQRIGLARAFLHNAPLLLLDEPTSSLDSLNEAIILKSLKSVAKNKTTVLVSHRRSTMCVADKVVAM